MSTWARRDDDAPHQIRLNWQRDRERGVEAAVAVSCTCWARKHVGNKNAHTAMGYVYGDESPWDIFNDPDKHNPQADEPFSDEHKGGSRDQRGSGNHHGGSEQGDGSGGTATGE